MRPSFDRYKGGAGESGESGSAAERSGERDPGSEPSASESKDKVLAWPEGADRDGVAAAAASIFLVRDLISTPCEHMGPQHLEVTYRVKCRANRSWAAKRADVKMTRLSACNFFSYSFLQTGFFCQPYLEDENIFSRPRPPVILPPILLCYIIF